MLVLYETSLGYCLFKLTDSAKLKSTDLWEEFQSAERANSILRLKAIHRFTSTATAVEDITALQEGKLGKGLKQFLSAEIVEKGKTKESLVVVDSKLANAISKKLGIKVHADGQILDLFRGIRNQLASLLDGLDPKDLATMNLGLSHSLSRFKLKFSPEKVDTMVVQAIALLDDLDKELNIYSMRVKEWYGWHFPEMGKILTDSLAYAKVVKAIGFRTNASTTSLAAILPEDLEATIKVAAEISMGTEISETDIAHIHALCDQIVAISAYRVQLSEYLRNRMNAIAPNLTALVGELVGARLISHAGTLLNLAKHPASTIQILGAEKALFRALKTKHDTPKYGLIYHASLVGQASPKLKGKMARMVATKAALSIRVDALTDADGKSEMSAPTIGLENRGKLESRLRALEQQSDTSGARAFSTTGKKQQRLNMNGGTSTYNNATDSVGLISTQRDPVERALQTSADVKEEKRKIKEERRAKKRAEKEKALAIAGVDTHGAEIQDYDKDNQEGEGLQESEVKSSKKDKKRKRRETELDVEPNENGSNAASGATGEDDEKKARKKAKKAEKAISVAATEKISKANGESTTKKRKKE